MATGTQTLIAAFRATGIDHRFGLPGGHDLKRR